MASLVVGGTGMLAKAACWLASRSNSTLILARGASRFAAGRNDMIAVDADWHDPNFRAILCKALDKAPPIECALLWLHEPDPIIAWLQPRLGPARIVLVLGSLDGQPALPQAADRLATVRLGSVAMTTGRRWLTDDEISGGAIGALQDGSSRIVGDLLNV